MGKLLGIFGGGASTADDAAPEATEAPAAAASPVSDAPDVPAFAADAIPVPQQNPYASIDDYASSLPAPDYVDPAGKASARAEAA